MYDLIAFACRVRFLWYSHSNIQIALFNHSKPKSDRFMVKACINNLYQLKVLMEVIPGEAYTRKSKWLSGATIGQHIRHILEFYTCLLDCVTHPESDGQNHSAKSVRSDADQSGSFFEVCVVNYGNRARDTELETWPEKALEAIDFVCARLASIQQKPGAIITEGKYEIESDAKTRISSSFDRELLYNLEHAIHHQALMRVSLLEQNLENLIDENFGVAPSTIRARKIK